MDVKISIQLKEEKKKRLFLWLFLIIPSPRSNLLYKIKKQKIIKIRNKEAKDKMTHLFVEEIFYFPNKIHKRCLSLFLFCCCCCCYIYKPFKFVVSSHRDLYFACYYSHILVSTTYHRVCSIFHP